ncbi:hypothetical protein AVEN_39478-1 [Araneus ventricosus]|uniref:Uncharacterized protein n=1 Tax=Araneus ventricosus TaxID=182803 RepID=A0A4Y2D631_ARAVE|nr:hypothetical protein AVEN_39478-1 [Araneus ventricosus]
MNIKGLPQFGVRWRVFFNAFVPVGIINVCCLVLLTNSLANFQVCYCGSYWNILFNGHPLFLLFPLHTFRRFNDNYRRARPCLLNGQPSKRGHEKYTPKFLGCVGESGPQMFPYKWSEKFYERQSLTLVENEGSVNSLLLNS